MMADWLNHVSIKAPRNAATTHTVTPSTANVGTTAIGTGVVAGAVVAGTLFTPTAGRFLVLVVEGAVTSTTPTSWTLPTGGSAVNNTGLYAWYRASAAGSDTITTTHNAANYSVVFDWYEFGAGSTFSGSVSATAVAAAGGAGPTLTGLTGTNWIAGAAAQTNASGTASSITWNLGTEQGDVSEPRVGTDGFTYGLTALDSSTATSQAFAATFAGGGSTIERLVFAVKPSGVVATATRYRTIGKRH